MLLKETLYSLSFILLINLSKASTNDSIREDAKLLMPNLVTKHGYPLETYNVTTQDGYILGLHRMKRANATPIILAHSFMTTSAIFVLMGPTRGLAYYLYDNGYDVWMTNDRGNKYSSKHTTFNEKSSKYWDFSFHEIGIYDLRTIIDFVLQTTGQKSLHMIGYDQGALTSLILCSERPQYVKKISLLLIMAPPALIGNTKSPLLLYFKLPLIAPILGNAVDLLGIFDFHFTQRLLNSISGSFCKIAPNFICKHALFLLGGYNGKHFDADIMPMLTDRFPDAASVKQLRHYSQLVSSGKFQQFDYGLLKNYGVYGTTQPREYNLNNIRTNVGIYYAANDWLAPRSGMKILFNQLPIVVQNYLVPDADFAHFDFVFANDVKTLVNERILKDIKSYENGDM